ncbi:putative enzyme related to lactoylglutathione lyase [Catenulispora sp. MAP5-51]|uniref:VOC family protein n=1 Tax=Catenulispora sp. MAP5-51 TaxID=3156298 RepID=UPI003518EBE4
MTVIRHITLDADNPYELGRFWESVLSWQMDPECAPGDGEVLLHGPEGLPGLLLIEVPEPKTAKSRMHFDLMPQTTRDEELARVLGLGAKVVEDHRKADGAGWVWCEDPEGYVGAYRNWSREIARPLARRCAPRRPQPRYCCAGPGAGYTAEQEAHVALAS